MEVNERNLCLWADRYPLRYTLHKAEYNDGKQIRLSLPALTEERRHELVKVVHNRLEECRIAVRNVRRDVHNDMRDFEKEKLISEDDLKRGEEDLQKVTDHHIEEINKHGQHKEQEIMEV